MSDPNIYATDHVGKADYKGTRHIETLADLGRESSVDDGYAPKATIRNPLGGLSKQTLRVQVSAFCSKYGFQEKEDVFQKAALVAQTPDDFEHIQELSQEDLHALRREITRMEPKTIHEDD